MLHNLVGYCSFQTIDMGRFSMKRTNWYLQKKLYLQLRREDVQMRF